MSGAERLSGTRPSLSPVVVGYVEAVTTTAALGWVWCPGRAERIAVELRLGTETLSRVIADGLRDDLAASGIGDGKHAFSLAVPEAFSARSAEMTVFAVPEDGPAVALDAPAPANTVQESSLAPIQRSLDMLIGSQRLMHRNLQAALLQKGPSVSASLTEVASAQAALRDSIESLEVFLVRLEQATSLRDVSIPAVASHRMLLATVGVATLALIASSVALGRIMLGS